MTAQVLASITLNISFLIYMLLYLPQVLHNRNSANLTQVSLYWHTLMYISLSFDFFYGLSMNFAWQYCSVSTMGMWFIISQQWQLYNLHRNKVYLLVLIIHFYLLLLFFTIFKMHLNYNLAQIISAASRITGLIAMLPQIKFNYLNKTARGLSNSYLKLNLCLVGLDTTSAWLLDWGWPNKIATPVTGLLYLILWLQTQCYATSNPQNQLLALMFPRRLSGMTDP
jgi:hypothetical protein